jgi:hypothetical protein
MKWGAETHLSGVGFCRKGRWEEYSLLHIFGVEGETFYAEKKGVVIHTCSGRYDDHFFVWREGENPPDIHVNVGTINRPRWQKIIF